MIRFLKIYRFSTIFLLVNAMLFQTFPKTLVMLDYYLNTNTYASYCVNKDKPKMHCNGLCQLDKKMDDLDHHQDDSSQPVEMTFSNYIQPEIVYIQPVVLQKISSHKTIYVSPFIGQECRKQLFRPPIFSISYAFRSLSLHRRQGENNFL